MKRANSLKTVVFSLIVIALLSCPSWATTPVAVPFGLAVAANGNLYVANYGGSQVLVYNPSYVQTKVITAGVSNPTGIAFDSQGFMYVANSGSGSITVYDSTGKQIPSATITAGLVDPVSIAVDGSDQVWVDDVGATLYVFAPLEISKGQAIGGGEALNSISAGSENLAAIAAHGRFLDAAPNTGFVAYYAGEVSTNHLIVRTGGKGARIPAMTSDSKGNFYHCQQGGEVDLMNPYAMSTSAILTLGYTPTGIAVDLARKRIYFSNSGSNAIDVYSTAGAYITTIH